MEIGVLSDTHLHSVTDDFARRIEKIAQEVDHLFHLGDIVTPEVLDFLNSFPLSAVAGNMDLPEIRANLPVKRVVELGGKRFGLIHGWGSPFGLDKRVAAEFDGVDCVCFGHSHKTLIKDSGGLLVFNPGSARGGMMAKPTYGRLTVTKDGISARHLPF